MEEVENKENVSASYEKKFRRVWRNWRSVLHVVTEKIF